MESRVPKPKIAVSKKTYPTTIVKAETPKLNDAIKYMPNSSGNPNTIRKSKSTFNINVDTSKANEPPAKPTLRRSQSSASLAMKSRPTVSIKLKRMGVPKIGTEAKRANAKLKVKSMEEPEKTEGPSVKIMPKPSKWDLRGRLECCNVELANLKEKHKRCAHLENVIDEMRAKETSMLAKLKECENTKVTLTEELSTVKKGYTNILDDHENMKLKLEQSQTFYEKSSEALLERQKMYESQKKMIEEHATKVEHLEKNYNEHKIENKELSKTIEDLQSLIYQIDKDRRILHNAIQELKGNIRVFCRVRPRIPRESSKPVCSINFIDESTMEIGRADLIDYTNNPGKPRGTKQEFSFDKIFPPTATQAEVFEELSLLVQSALEGYNVCVFAYGQTGSGKTYTMEGGEDTENEGMIPRTVRHIFQEMKVFELLGWEYKIEASFLEIYNEHIVDLLDCEEKNHEIRMADSKGNDLYVTNVLIAEINSPEELHVCLQTARQNRAVAATFANERSSRSHSITRIRLIGVHAGNDERCIGNLNLVDLAGSERLKSDATVRTTETKNINKSLANLGNVILALLKKQDHVPYRNSKLTHLLMPSLGGNSKTLMLLNVSPLDECFNETLNSLRFASNVNNCKTGNIKRSRTVINNSM